MKQVKCENWKWQLLMRVLESMPSVMVTCFLYNEQSIKNTSLHYLLHSIIFTLIQLYSPIHYYYCYYYYYFYYYSSDNVLLKKVREGFGDMQNQISDYTGFENNVHHPSEIMKWINCKAIMKGTRLLALSQINLPMSSLKNL